MKQHEKYKSVRDVNENDDDDDDDRKPPARTSDTPPPPPSRSNGRSNRNDDDEEEEEHYSESGVNSHASSTAVGSVDHWSFRDHHRTSLADRRTTRPNDNWWHPGGVLFSSSWSPFGQSSSSTSKSVPELVPSSSSSSKRPSHPRSDADFMYQTPTNANMIQAIRNDIHQDRRHPSTTGIPHLTLATPYATGTTTPDRHSYYYNRGATTNPQPQHPTFHPTNHSVSHHPNVNTTTTPNNTNALITTTATTIGNTTSSVPSSSSSPVFDHITNTTISSLQRNSMIYFGSTTVAWMVLWSHILPPVVLYTLLWIVISTVLMVQAFYTTLQEYYYHMVVMGPGLGSLLLPPSVYNLLTQESLHEFLTDEVMVLEYRHLLLYFLPISSTQLRDLLRRISPQHQQRLQRRGEIGTMLLGESMMRIILGHTQYEQWRTRHSSSSGLAALSNDGNNSNNSRNITMNGPSVMPRNHIPSSTIPHQVTAQQASPRRNTTLLSDHSFDDDEHSDLGLDISGDDLIGGNEALAERLGLTTTTTLPNEVITTSAATTSNATGTNRNSTAHTANDATARVATYDDQEYQVLIDAMWDSFYGAVWNPMADYVTTTYMVPTLRRISRVTLHSGIILLSISAGNICGLWEWWYQIIMNNSRRGYLPTRGLISPATPQNRDTTPMYRNPSSQRATTSFPSFASYSRPRTMTWSTALLGSASLGISYYSRRYVRNYDTSSIVDSYTGRSDHHETSNNPNQTKSLKLAESTKEKE